jgi:hypothetical protein
MYDPDLQELIDEMAHEPEETEEPERGIADADRWLLSSNLQKAVRRGLTTVATQSAQQLFQLDSEYVWRRLAVIAFEDVGLAAPERCTRVLSLFRRKAMRQKLGDERVLRKTVRLLTSSIKSRALCDGIATLEFGPIRNSTGDEVPLTVVLDSSKPLVARIAACRELCGWSSMQNGLRKMQSRVDRSGMETLSASMNLTPNVAQMFLKGNGVRDYMNVPVPVIQDVISPTNCIVETSTRVFEGKDGVLHAALDRHTRKGKLSLRRFAAELPGDLLPMRDRIGAVGAAIFIVEGSALDRWLVSPELEVIRSDFEDTFLDHYGCRGSNAQELIAAVRENLSTLNLIRDEVLG